MPGSSRVQSIRICDLADIPFDVVTGGGGHPSCTPARSGNRARLSRPGKHRPGLAQRTFLRIVVLRPLG